MPLLTMLRLATSEELQKERSQQAWSTEAMTPFGANDLMFDNRSLPSITFLTFSSGAIAWGRELRARF